MLLDNVGMLAAEFATMDRLLKTSTREDEQGPDSAGNNGKRTRWNAGGE